MGGTQMKRFVKISFILSLFFVLFVSQVSATTKFSDIRGHWAEQTIIWAEQQGIAGGYPDKTFRPNRHVTEAEFLALLIRSYNPSDFKYINNEYHWADSYYAYARNMNYPNEGYSSKEKRDLKINREKVAEIVSSTQGVNYKGRDAIHYLLGKGLAAGKKPNDISIDSYAGQDYLTRAEAVTFIKNVLEKGIKDESGNPIIKPRPTNPSPIDELPSLPEQPVEIKFLTVAEMMDAVDSQMQELGLKANPAAAKTNGVSYRGEGKNRVSYRDYHEMVGFGIDELNETNIKGLEIMMKQIGITLNDEIKALIYSANENKIGTDLVGHYSTDTFAIAVYEYEGTISFMVAKKK